MCMYVYMCKDLTVDVSDVPDRKVKSQLGVLVPDRTKKASLGCNECVCMLILHVVEE